MPKPKSSGSTSRSFFTPGERVADKPASALTTATETGRWEDEGWRVRKDGTRFWASAILDTIRDSGGKLVGFEDHPGRNGAPLGEKRLMTKPQQLPDR